MLILPCRGALLSVYYPQILLILTSGSYLYVCLSAQVRLAPTKPITRKKKNLRRLNGTRAAGEGNYSYRVKFNLGFSSR